MRITTLTIVLGVSLLCLSRVAVGLTCTSDNECGTNEQCKVDSSHLCECLSGFAVSHLTGACEDINECEAAVNPCSSRDSRDIQFCCNSDGGYKCFTKSMIFKTLKEDDTLFEKYSIALVCKNKALFQQVAKCDVPESLCIE